MNYTPSKFNYSLLDNGELIIVNLKRGLSTLNKIIYQLSDRFSVPAYILGKESDVEKLYATVIAFFTSDTEVES